MTEKEDSETNEKDEEHPVNLSMDEGEALALLHVLWEKELDWAGDPETIGLSELMSELNARLSHQVYSDEVVEWIETRREEQEEAREQFQEQLGNVGGGPPPDPNGQGPFQ